MKIEKRINIMLAVSLVLVTAFGASMFYSFKQERKAIAAHDKSEEMYQKVFKLNALTYDYLMQPTERAREQWQQLSGDLAALMTAPVFVSAEQKTILGRISKTHSDINNDFSRLVTVHGKHGTMGQGEHDVYYNMETSITRHLLIEMQAIIEQSLSLGRIGDEYLHGVQQTTALIQAVFFMLLFAMLLANFYRQRKGIILPVKKLMNGVEIIGSGNLAYKTGITTKDEIGELSAAFDRMTGNLKNTTASRNELEREVAGRIDAELKLRALMQDLEQTNRELEQKLNEIKTLRGILPICSYCKKIRDDKGSWEQMEMYIRDHSEAEFSHGMCPACAEKAEKEFEEFRKKGREEGDKNERNS